MVIPEEVGRRSEPKPDVFVAYLGEAAFRRGQEIARRLRHEGFWCILTFGGGSLKSQMRQANKLGARNVVIIGDDELARERYPVKRMDAAVQTDMSLEELLSQLRSDRT
jgi:histidyl-tRNA synthetase